MNNDPVIHKYLQHLDTKDNKIKSALKLAFEKHNNQYRKSGEPYIEHCLEVYKILKKWGVSNKDLLIAALLHDILEDSDTSKSSIIKKFGEEVGFLVEGVTQLKIESGKKQDFETLKKVVSSSYIDPKVAILKLADRYHNLNTLQYMSGDKREVKAKESLEVYAKLAESLGLWVVKTEIEDLSFKYLQFDKYSFIKNTVDSDSRLSKDEVARWEDVLTKSLKALNIDFEIGIKKTGYYHFYKKLKLYSVKGLSSSIDHTRINDIISYRVRVKNLEDCYLALYKIHQDLGDFVDFNRFDEFVGSNKRINGYQALQTTLETDSGSIEIAFVTNEMENFNNWGYISNLNSNLKSSTYNLKLIFTPSCDLVFLPQNAKAIDFAYAINSKLGDNSIKVKVNDKEETLKYELKNTDTVKVVTGDRSTDQDIELLTVALPMTKMAIQNKIIEKEKLGYIEIGKEVLASHLAPRGILDLRDILSDVDEIVYSLGCESINDVYYKISKGYLNVEKLDNLLNERNITKSSVNWSTLEVSGKDRPGVLKIITDEISKNHGNIVRLTYRMDDRNNKFYLRVVAEGIDPSDLFKMNEHLKSKLFDIDIKIV